MQDLENHFHLSYREINTVVLFISEPVVEIVNLNYESMQTSQINVVKIKTCFGVTDINGNYGFSPSL